MSMMRAVTLSGTNQSSVELRNVPIPSNGPDELLVRVKAIGVGIHDAYFLPAGHPPQYPIGIEAAGVVEQVGSGLIDRYAPGDRIAFVSFHQMKGGTWAEYAVVAADSQIITIPADMTFEQAAAMPVAGGTTLRALHALPPIPNGGSIFVAGASGAIGTFVVQLARARGWNVAGSASPRNHDYLTSLGACKTVDYNDPEWVEQILDWMPGGVDGALAILPNTTADSIRAVKDHGTVVTISDDRVDPPSRGIRVTGLDYRVDAGEVAKLIDQIHAGSILVEIEQVYLFDEAPAALDKVRTRHARGKIVLSLR